MLERTGRILRPIAELRLEAEKERTDAIYKPIQEHREARLQTLREECSRLTLVDILLPTIKQTEAERPLSHPVKSRSRWKRKPGRYSAWSQPWLNRGIKHERT